MRLFYIKVDLYNKLDKLDKLGTDRPPFEPSIWRSLRPAPPLFDRLADLIEFLSDRQETAGRLS